MLIPNRRQFLRAGALAAGALALARVPLFAEENPTGFKLPPLPYAYDALEPSIDKQTMEIHHDKHHAAYVNNLNTLLKDHPDYLKMSVEDVLSNASKLPDAIRQGVINNAGGHLNHSQFWVMMAHKDKGGEAKGDLLAAINSTFTSLENFQKTFSEAATKRFGSGWAWLVMKDGKLSVVSTANQDAPLLSGQVPLLGLDVWEHAYYLKYQNRRPDYIKAWWAVVNWNDVGERFGKAKKG
jgi:Fe-Mn family superoxide dismutase